jgi:hypothetical protein
VSLHLALDRVRIDRGERTLITDLSAAIAPGDFVAIIGPQWRRQDQPAAGYRRPSAARRRRHSAALRPRRAG